MSVELYFDMIGRKTAALIAARSRPGPYWPPTTSCDRAVPRLRLGLGIAFQLNDDLLGIWGEQASTARSRPTWPGTR